MKVFIVTHKVPGYEPKVCSVHLSLDEAKAESERLDAASSWASTLVVEREVTRPREWTPEQRRWMRGTP